jgi:hypothetical protein
MTTAFWFEVRRCRGMIIAALATSVAYSAIMALFWPLMRDNTALLQQYLDLFPKGFLSAFGMEGSLADPGIFFSTYISGWYWPIVAALVGIILATRPAAVDLERGFLDLPLATALSRVRYAVAVIGAQALLLAVLAFGTVLAFSVSSAIVGAPYDLARMLIVALLASMVAWGITACAAALSVVTLSRAIAGGTVAAVLLAMYLLNIVAQIQPDLGGLGTLSAFHYFRPAELIDNGVVPFTELALFALIALGAWAFAVVAFRRRDLAA